jgi:hypothetical protein
LRNAGLLVERTVFLLMGIAVVTGFNAPVAGPVPGPVKRTLPPRGDAEAREHCTSRYCAQGQHPAQHGEEEGWTGGAG